MIGTAIGSLAMRSRARLQLYTSPLETIGTSANDHLAEYLVTRLAERSFVDVGAHIGSIIAAVKKNCPGVTIAAVEAIPEKAEWLSARFTDVKVFPCAASDYEGRTSFFIDPEASGYSSLARSRNARREITVPVKRLDTLVSDPEVVKIDVEGAELGVLRGSENFTSRPVYMFESAPHDVLGYTKAALWQWFADRDYGILLPNRLAHEGPPMSLGIFEDSHLYPRRTTNYFGVPLERIDQVRKRAAKLLKLKPYGCSAAI
jgi:FkbM family methyltransferase